MLSLPSSLAVVGIVPGIILIVFLGVFATYTSWLLVKFKMNHPEVHTMGDAGFILFGPIGREVLAFGTVVFAICATGGQLLAGQVALASLSDNKLCTILYTGIFAIPTLICSFPRTFDGLSWLSIGSVCSIAIAGVVGMIGAGLHPEPGREFDIVQTTTFISVTNPVFAYAGHFMCVLALHEEVTLRRANIPTPQVLHPRFRNAPPARRHESRLHAPVHRDKLLRRLRGRHIRLHRQRSRLTLLLVPAARLAESGVRHRAAQLFDRG
jgi:hypothetical protein